MSGDTRGCHDWGRSCVELVETRDSDLGCEGPGALGERRKWKRWTNGAPDCKRVLGRGAVTPRAEQTASDAPPKGRVSSTAGRGLHPSRVGARELGSGVKSKLRGPERAGDLEPGSDGGEAAADCTPTSWEGGGAGGTYRVPGRSWGGGVRAAIRARVGVPTGTQGASVLSDSKGALLGLAAHAPPLHACRRQAPPTPCPAPTAPRPALHAAARLLRARPRLSTCPPALCLGPPTAPRAPELLPPPDSELPPGLAPEARIPQGIARRRESRASAQSAALACGNDGSREGPVGLQREAGQTLSRPSRPRFSPGRTFPTFVLWGPRPPC